MKKHLALLSLILLSTILSCQSAFALTQQEADVYNNLYYPQSVYNGGINTAPQQSVKEAYVNPATGSTHISVTDVTLPGVNGFDLNITRMYNSTNASLFEAYLKETNTPYQQEYYMITGSKLVHKDYINGEEANDYYYNLCLTPDFMTYLQVNNNDDWMVRNTSEYEYEYVEWPNESHLFSSYDEAMAVVNFINSTSNEISSSSVYSGISNYNINYFEFKVITVEKTEYRTDYTDGLLDDTATERYSKLGAGWEFTFPYIETRYGHDNNYEYLHFGEKGTWLVDFYEGGDNNLSGYSLNDIKIVQDPSLTHDGIQSKYRVDEKDGTKHYFGTDGRLLIQQDRYGNQIKFFCSTENYINVWGEWEDYPYIREIEDTLGRRVGFTFENEEDGDVKMYMKIENPNDDTDIRQYTYFLKKLSNSEIDITGYSECDDLACDEWVLKTVTNPVGQTYTYNYDLLKTKFAFLNRNECFYSKYYGDKCSAKGNSYLYDNDFKDFTGIYNTYALIRSSIRTDGKSYYFKYAPFIKNCTPNGSMIFYKAYNSHEETAYSYSGAQYNMNEKSYIYDINGFGEYDGYSGYTTDEVIRDDYDYAVKVTDKNIPTGKTSYDIYKYTYLGASRDKTILLTRLTDYGTDHNIITDYTYDNDLKIITSQTTRNYSVSDPSVYMTNSIAYTYDSDGYADVLTQTTNGEGDRTVTYTYNSTYHYPVSKTYKQNGTTTIREEYVPTSDNKAVEYINIYQNDVLKSKIQYSHDSYGNIVNEKKYINSTDYIEKQFVYQNGAFVTTETTKNIKDNDNVSKEILVTATYDCWGNPLTMTDENGNVTRYSYDGIDRVLTITNPDGSSKSYIYRINLEIREIDEVGNEIRTYYTGEQNIESISYQSLGLRHSEMYYDCFGNLETEVINSDNLDSGGNQTEYNRTAYTYDTYQRPLTKEVYDSSNSLIYKETYSYDVTTDYVKETITVVGGDKNPSVVTSVYYDKYGNKIKTENGSDYETYTLDYAGNITSVKSARANSEGWSETHQTEYDFMGNITKETNEIGNIERAEYDQLGRIVKTYDANNYATEYKYDNLGRVIEQKTPFEEKCGTVYYSTKQMWYDNNGNVIKERVYTNAAGESETYNEVKYTYDNRNRLVMTESNDGEKSNYVQNYYDAKGSLLRVYTGLHSPLTINGLDNVTGTDTEYAVTKYSYDRLGRLLTTTDALGQVETNTYDLSTGLLETTTDRNENTVNYTYNGLGSVTSKSLSDGTNAQITTYGLTGKPLSMQNSTATISYVYNDKGLLVSETNSASGVIKSFTYDSAGNVLTMTITRNGTVDMSQSYTYDKLNRLTTVSENGTIIATYSYDNKNNRTKTIVTGGETTNYSYNLANMLTSQITGEKLSETYSYYLNGNQKSKVSNGQTTNYTYDSMNRLISENNTQYTFDDFGNRLTMSGGEVTTTYSFDLNNRLIERSEENGDITTNTKFFYDNNGNQITKATMVNQPYAEGISGDYTISDNSNNYVALYEYNCYNQLVGVDTNGVISSYTYSPDGLRHSKTVDGNTTIFVYDNANVIEEITEDGANKYYRGIEIIKNDDGLYYLYNGQGDVSLLTDSTGTTIANYIFDAYGNQSEESTVYNPFGYRGEYTDDESGVIYLRNRYYDSNIGRFITEDPIKDGLNWYVYGSNNSVNRVDPSGLKDYIYTSQNDYYIENDWGFWEFLNTDRYYAEIDGSRYKANSKETVTLYDWNSFDTDFLNGTLDSLVSTANTKSTDAKRILSQSVGGDLDFKLQMDKEKLYLANGILYNKNEAGNYVWAYFLESKNVSGYISGALAQGGTILSPLINMNEMPRLDEEWDRQARWAGVKYYYDRNNKWWVYYALYGGRPKY